ncbi:MAG: potassium channel protein [Candidatus Riflebacteria bacterium]|nr:potassium channel protein [Candidatus Riflebacteria bacterium]
MQKRKIFSATVVFLIVLAIGTFGYRLIEGPSWSLIDGLFMTVITLATVGYGETHPLTDQGRLFTVGLILVGAGLMAYMVTTLAQFVVEGGLRDYLGRRRMRDRIKALRHHYIICGAGSTGWVVAERLHRQNTPVVLVDTDPKVVQELLDQRFIAIEGDATADEVLIDAGLEMASGLVAALPHDADNVFVALTAKGINPNVFVAATATKIESVPKLKRAGANYVVSPNITAANRMASVLMRPSVVDFLDATLSGDDQDLQMDEFRIQPGSFLDTQALKDADLRRRSGAIIVSVKRQGKTVINPEPAYVFAGGDILVVMGNRDQINKMGELATAPAAKS